ncbi:MAG TPA: phosphate ABC transporter permease subunit PstC [Acidimicrobiales bacterium]|nr:phosphate ABC transporter permease subunit PstC [Acidimicrobiales bacterium]
MATSTLRADRGRARIERARRRSELTPRDRVVRAALGVTGAVPALALVFITYQTLRQAYPSIVFNGAHFFTGRQFSIGNSYGGGTITRHGYHATPGAVFGIGPLIFGTVVSSLIALAVAVPISVGAAILLAERLPSRLQGPLGVFLELLAGIPSVVFGLWGVATFGPLLARDVERHLSDLHIPWLTGSIQHNGQGLLTSALVLALMIIPIIASTTRELVRSVPALTKEGAVALGLTGTESVRLVTLPFIRTGIVAASLLGLARALGETIAVLLISTNASTGYPHSVFAGFSTMAAFIAGELDGAFGDSTGMAVHALAEVGLVILVITLLTNLAGRAITRRLAGPGLPVGRGI